MSERDDGKCNLTSNCKSELHHPTCPTYLARQVVGQLRARAVRVTAEDLEAWGDGAEAWAKSAANHVLQGRIEALIGEVKRLRAVAQAAALFREHACHCAIINEGRGPKCASCLLRQKLEEAGWV